MGHRAGHGPPYATACLILGYAGDMELKAYVNGKLALAGLDSRVSAAVWLDAIYAIVAEAPVELLKKMHGQIVIESAKLRPDRDTWGATPEHVAMQNKVIGKQGSRGAAPAAARSPGR